MSAPFGDKTRFKFAVNSAGTDKVWDFKLLASQFKDREGTIVDVKRHVKSGHALCAGLLNGKWRAKSNVIGSYWILLDIDNSDVLRSGAGQPILGEDGKTTKIYKHDLTLDEALAHPFVQKYCALIYTTASHKPDWHKFRLVFLLPEFVEGADTVEACTRLLMQQFPHDPACKDASRVFYGSTKAEFPLTQPNATLPREWVQQAQEVVVQERIEFARRLKEVENRRKQFQELSRSVGWDIDQLIQQALSHIPSRSPGSNNYQECLSVLMALVSHYGETEAEAIAEQWSPSIKGTTWNIRQKIRSFRRGGVSIGTLFHIAKQYGFKFPKVDNHVKGDSYDEPDSRLYNEYLERENSDARNAKSEELQYLVSKGANRIKRLLSKAFKGFGKKPVTKIAPKVLKIKPGEVPTLLEYETLGKPRLDFTAADRNAILAEAIGKGWKHILDGSGTGAGKSYAAGEAQPSDLGVEQLWYLAVDHRNPTTSTVEAGYTDLPVRNNGFKIDPLRKTPLGKSFQVWGKEGDRLDTNGNCDRTGLFHALAEKNINVQESSTSPICQSCPHYTKMVEIIDGNGKSTYRPQCSSKSGDGFGFRFQYSSALGISKLRAHPSSAPKPKIDFTKNDDGEYIDPGYDYSSAGAFWDEAGILIETQSVLEVRLKDLQQVYYKVPTLISAGLLFKHDLDPLWQVLMGLLDPSFRGGYIPDSGRFGMNNADIRALLPSPPENLNKIIEFLKKELAPNLSFLQEKGDRIDFKSVLREDRRSAMAANLALNAQDSRQKAQALENVMLNWFIPFLEAWRDESGYFKRDLTGSVLRIYSRSDRHINIASSCKWNIYLDATLSPQMLASMLDTENILYIKQEMPSYKNLRVIQVTGMGRLSSDRRESADLRVTAALAELQASHPGLAVIDWKAKATLGQGYHFRDGRGVNRFKDAPALAIVGTPCPNIGALAIKYQLLKNKPAVEDSPEFQAFVDEHIQAEILQEVGRLRANLRPDEQLSAYVLSDYDLDFLKTELPDASFEQLDAFRLSPDAGDKLQRTKYGILKAFSKLIESGKDYTKITQDAIASSMQGEITRSRISQIAALFGGWSKLRKMLILLYKTLFSNKTNNSENLTQSETEPDSDLLWLSLEYLPLIVVNLEDEQTDDVVREILHVIEAEGPDRFKSAVQLTDNGTKNGILGYLTALLTTDFAQTARSSPS
ncbi:hypothetical protein NIES4075_69180 [Tolypothrix sp. NIES-4075]|uniref:PriCT-2 domain-containing protein n=1 Tax=Tolypothrix sp. NIES-4075 TaxID=2005459 RepID=UPI000B5C26FB|nr:PriCT-2 domain-containing protein [Tolypothrix sp. NIES-4075]GAX45897.1 hypothetical protein NIES4075_69180 [Tolypothrix sp. NIES-4075]